MARLDQINQLLAESPGDAFLQFALAKEYEKLGDDAAARRHYEELRKAQPDYVGLYYHLAKTLERLGYDAPAFATYTQGMEVARRAGDGHALSELAGARLELGDEEDFAE
ncbi:MAG: tetratricopeptide repeat protein [Saprospiraceae bacterium]